MARNQRHLLLFFFFVVVLSCASVSGSEMMKKKKRVAAAEKLSTIVFYWQDIIQGVNRSDYAVILRPENGSTDPFGFGSLSMVDIPLTHGPELDSKLMGRAQGLYARASLEGRAYLMVINICFTTGQFKDSTLTVLGRNDRDTPLRELPIIGGTGDLRFARGYVKISTSVFNPTTLYAVLKLKAYVLHF